MAAERERRGLRAHRWSWLAALGAVAALVAGITMPAIAAAVETAQSSSSALATSTTADASASLSILSAPSGAGLVRQGDDYRVRVTLTNTGEAPTGDLTVSLHVSGATAASRDELAAWFADDAADDPADIPSDAATVVTETLSSLAPGSSAVLDLAVAGERPGLSGAFGARTALVTAQGDGGTITVADRTALVWVPSAGTVPSVNTTFVAALSTPGNRSALLSADDVNALTSEAGDLTRLLDAVAGRPVLVGIDPRVIASIRALGTSASADALAFLDRLERLPNETFLLPWADADPVSTLAAAGVPLPAPEGGGAALTPDNSGPGDEPSASPTLSSTGDETEGTGSADDSAAAASAAALAELSDWPVSLTGWSWLGAEGLDVETLDALAESGTSTAVVPSSAIGGEPVVQSAAVLLGADDALATAAHSASLADSQQVHDAGLARVGALLAATARDGAPFALIELSREELARSDRLVSTIAQTIMLPWADSADASSARANPAVQEDLNGESIDDLRATAIDDALDAERADRRFAEIAESPSFITDVRRLELLAALSQGWGERSAIELDRFVVASGELRRSVQVVESSAILLLADRTSLPITVQNDLEVPVRVFVRVDPDTGRLRVLDSNVETLVEPQSQTRAVVPVESVTNGDVRITVSVRDAEGREIGTPTRVALDLQAGWETLGVLIVGGATLLLLVVGITRDLRKRERRREAERLERTAASGEHPAPDTTGTTDE